MNISLMREDEISGDRKYESIGLAVDLPVLMILFPPAIIWLVAYAIFAKDSNSYHLTPMHPHDLVFYVANHTFWAGALHGRRPIILELIKNRFDFGPAVVLHNHRQEKTRRIARRFFN